MSVSCIADQDRETDRHYVEGASLAVLIVAQPDHLLYHPPAHASEVEDRLCGELYNVLHQVHLWMADIIVINPTHTERFHCNGLLAEVCNQHRHVTRQ